MDYSAARRVITVFLAVLDGAGAPFVPAWRTACGQPIHGPERLQSAARWVVASFHEVSVCVVSERMRVQICLTRDDACALLFVQHDARALLNIHAPCALHYFAVAVALLC